MRYESFDFWQHDQTTKGVGVPERASVCQLKHDLWVLRSITSLQACKHIPQVSHENVTGGPEFAADDHAASSKDLPHMDPSAAMQMPHEGILRAAAHQDGQGR